MEHTINTDLDPVIPFDNWKVEEHRKAGTITWNDATADLHLDEDQNHNLLGSTLRKYLANVPSLNANVLDFLLAHQDLIPDSWKMDSRKRPLFIFFWGTVYRGPGKRLFVRCLFFTGMEWKTRHRDLNESWHIDNPAAILVHR